MAFLAPILVRPGSIYVCASPKARKGKWRSLGGRSIKGPRYRDRVTVEASFFNHERLALVFAEWPGESYFAEHFRPLHDHTPADDVAVFLPLLRSAEAIT